MRSLYSMLRQPGYMFLAVTTLALAVGANLVVFGIVNALWLRPSVVQEPERVVVVLNGADNGSSTDSAVFAMPDVARDPATFVGAAGQVVTGPRDAAFVAHVQLEAVGHEVETLGVTSEYFSMLGLAVRGRDFRRDDDRRGAEPVAIISDRLWREAFDRRADVIGAVVPAVPLPIRIIGIAPPGFQGARLGERADLWIPRNMVPRVASQGDLPEDMVPLVVMARLRLGITPAGADTVLARSANPRQVRSGVRYHVVPVSRIFGAPGSRTIVINERGGAALVGVLAGLVLLAGCATLMALVLIHYEGRRQELAVRLALGSSRARLVRQLAAELAWLVAAGSIAAVLVAAWGLRALPALSLPGGVDLSRLDLSIDWRVLAGGITASIATLSVAAFVPVARSTRADLTRHLVGTSTATPSASSQRIRRTLLALHVAATMIVLVSAGLFVRAVMHGFTSAAGFDIDHTVFATVQVFRPLIVPGEDMRARQAAITARNRQLFEGVRSLPGVEAAAIGPAPIGPDQALAVLVPRSVTTGSVSREVRLGLIQAGPGFLDALDVPIIAGRPLTAADVSVRPTPVVVTASLARRLWPADTALGQTLSLSRGANTVVGIARDFRFGSLSVEPAGVLVTATDASGIVARLTIRTQRPTVLIPAVRQLVSTLLPNAQQLDLASGRDMIARDLGRQRLGALFFSGFGLVALTLGVGGVFGLVAYVAESRRREFGVRIALGATARDLVWQAMSAGLAPVVIGGACGLIAAAGVARFIASFLLGISPFDPVTYGLAGILMIGCAIAAGAVASWRLRHLTPGDALRAE